MILSAHGLSTTYGATPALIDAEFAIDAGEVARPTRACCSPTSPSVSGDERDVFFAGESPPGTLAFGATTWTIPAARCGSAPRS